MTTQKAGVSPANIGQHTPGPWRLDALLDENKPYGNIATVRFPRGQADIISDYEQHDDENRANARLIAEAPNLLRIVRAMSSVNLADAYPKNVDEIMFQLADFQGAALAIIDRIEDRQ